MKKQDLITEDDRVFLLTGKDDEIYIIDDPSIIARLDAKVNELKGMDETEIQKHLLPIVNPKKYGKRI
jgi:hypothetical protein